LTAVEFIKFQVNTKLCCVVGAIEQVLSLKIPILLFEY